MFVAHDVDVLNDVFTVCVEVRHHHSLTFAPSVSNYYRYNPTSGW